MEKVSIIIPTYKRVETLDKVLNSLIFQDNILEILVIDSDSNDGTDDLVNLYNKKNEISFKYLNVDNNVSLKRNTGIKESSAKYLIFLDDDCVPHKNFVTDHLIAMTQNPEDLNCGDVFFPKEGVEASNYIRYKESRHLLYRFSSTSELNLDFKTIVTMNMSVNKDQIVNNNIAFREDFIGYGMEDNEFGCQVMEAGIKINRCRAAISHMEKNDPFLFSTKIFHTARDGVLKLKSVNYRAVMDLPYSYFFEKDYVHKNTITSCMIKFLRLFFTIKLAKYILKFLNLTDSYRFFYLPFLYKYAYACYYNEGVKKRKDAYKSINEVSDGWYKKNVQ